MPGGISKLDALADRAVGDSTFREFVHAKLFF
jgi:hypothetical protein